MLDSPKAAIRTAGPFRLFAALFAVAFTVFFFTQDLYNSAPQPEQRISRLELLLLTTLPDAGNPYFDLAIRLANPAPLAQRAPILLVASAIVLSAMALGDLVLRLLIVGVSFDVRERLLYAYALGMGATSLGTLLVGLVGGLSTGTVLGMILAIGVMWLTTSKRRRPAPGQSSTGLAEPLEGTKSLAIAVCLVVSPFVLFSLLAAMIPTPDYDALAYHLLGPKEWFLDGRITFLPHNVYTTFPFLAEMFALLGMSATDDWFLGGLVGQTVLWSFGPAGGLAVFVLTKRLFGERAAWWAVLIYLTTPWIYRLSSIPYVEGPLLFFTTVAVDAASRLRSSSRWAAVAGALAGCAFACKYPGLVTTVAPVATIIAWQAFRERRPVALLWFAAGVIVVTSPWLIRNTLWTGNPVYPLADSIFSSPYWSHEQAEQFHKAHHSTDFGWGSIQRYLVEIPATSDWQSGLVFAFAPLALLIPQRRRAVLLWLLVAYLFAVFWGLTHRLDRFWLPLEPFAVVLAAAGAAWLTAGLGKTLCRLLIAVTLVYNLAYCTSGLCGMHFYFADLNGQLHSRKMSEPSLVLLSDKRFISADANVLFVGYAAVYYSDRPVLYNTVFDKNRLLDLVWDEASGQPADPGEIRTAFANSGINFVLVDWNWIERYRSPGNYGYPPEVTSRLFEQLQATGVLREINAAATLYPGLQLFQVTTQ